MELSSLELQIFVSLAVVLGTAFVALICDFLKGNNEQLRERNIELRVRQQERERIGLFHPQTWLQSIATAVQYAQQLAQMGVARTTQAETPQAVEQQDWTDEYAEAEESFPSRAGLEEAAQAGRRDEEFDYETASRGSWASKEDLERVAGLTAKIRARHEAAALAGNEQASIPVQPEEVAAEEPAEAGEMAEPLPVAEELPLAEEPEPTAAPVAEDEPAHVEPAPVEQAPVEQVVEQVIVEQATGHRVEHPVEQAIEQTVEQAIDEPVPVVQVKRVDEAPPPPEAPPVQVSMAAEESAEVAAPRAPEPKMEEQPVTPLTPPAQAQVTPVAEEPARADAVSEPEPRTQPAPHGKPVEPAAEPTPVRLLQFESISRERAEGRSDVDVQKEMNRLARMLGIKTPEFGQETPAEQPAESAHAPEAEPSAAAHEPEPAADLAVPPGMQDATVFAKLLESRNPFSGVVVTLGIGELPADSEDQRSQVKQLVGSLMRPRDFACRTRPDEFILLFPGEKGAAAQRRLHMVSETLWGFQLRSPELLSAVTGWGGLEVQGETLQEAVAAARERLQQNRRSRRTMPLSFTRLEKKVVNG